MTTPTPEPTPPLAQVPPQSVAEPTPHITERIAATWNLNTE